MSKKRHKQFQSDNARLTQPGVQIPILKAGRHSHSHSLMSLFGQRLLVALLSLLLILSAFGVVYIRDYHRRLFIQQQNLVKARNQLMMDWSKLLLEQTTWSNQARVQQIASQKLGMIVEPAKNIVMVKL